MHVERHRWHSPALGQEMEVEVYGHAGRPVLAFPSQDGRVGDFAGFGMIDACARAPRGRADAARGRRRHRLAELDQRRRRPRPSGRAATSTTTAT